VVPGRSPLRGSRQALDVHNGLLGEDEREYIRGGRVRASASNI
jgi:hypothetical protein